MVFFQFLLTLDLSARLDKRLYRLHNHQQQQQQQLPRSRSIARVLLALRNNLTFVVFLLVNLLSLYDFYKAYSLVAVLVCPFKTWMLAYAVYMRHACTHMPAERMATFVSSSSGATPAVSASSLSAASANNDSVINHYPMMMKKRAADQQLPIITTTSD